MPKVREFSFQCDHCRKTQSTSSDRMPLARLNAVNEGFHIMGTQIICDVCWQQGVRYADLSLAS